MLSYLQALQCLYHLIQLSEKYVPMEIIKMIMIMFYRVTRVQISCGWNHSAILIGESLHIFDNKIPSQLIDLPGINKIKCTPFSTFISTNKGDTYVLGSVDKCQEFGTINAPSNITAPFKLEISIPNIKKIKHTQNLVIITKSNEIYTNYTHVKKHVLPDTLFKIKCGSHVMVLTKSGRLYGYGENNCGQLGLGHKWTFAIMPGNSFEEVKSISNCINVSCGFSHTIALTSDNNLYVWGANKHGQLGLGDREDRHLPQKLVVEGISNSNIMSVRCGMDQTFILLDDRVYVCGYNVKGSLGREPYRPILTPLRLDFNIRIDRISSGQDHTIFRAIDNTLYVCGSNQFGQLGVKQNLDDKNKYIGIPTKIDYAKFCLNQISYYKMKYLINLRILF